MHRKYLLSLYMMLGVAIFMDATEVGVAQAASFDCKKAKSSREKMVCTDESLSQQDDALASVYNEFLGKIHPDSQRLVARSETDWSKYIDTLCTPKGHDKTKAIMCLGDAYEARRKFLEHGMLESGPYRFINIGIYRAWKTDEDPTADEVQGNYPGFGYENITYPWIDQPASKETQRFNDYLAGTQGKEISTENPADLLTDVDGEAYVLYASDDWVSVSLVQYFYPHGAAHGQRSMTYVNFSMKEGRLLGADDLFDKTKPWEQIIGDLTLAALKKQATEGNLADDFDDRAARDYAIDDSFWSIGSDGITIHYPDYSLGGYADGPYEVTLTWQDLKPYLRPDPIITIPQAP